MFIYPHSVRRIVGSWLYKPKETSRQVLRLFRRFISCLYTSESLPKPPPSYCSDCALAPKRGGRRQEKEKEQAWYIKSHIRHHHTFNILLCVFSLYQYRTEHMHFMARLHSSIPDSDLIRGNILQAHPEPLSCGGLWIDFGFGYDSFSDLRLVSALYVFGFVGSEKLTI